MSESTDFFSALLYGFQNLNNTEADFTASLYSGVDSKLFSVDNLMLSLLEHEIPAGKINLGIPLSGSSWEIDSSINKTDPPVKAFNERPTSNFNGALGEMPYCEICYNIRNVNGWKKITVTNNKTYAISPVLGSKRRIWVGYDDITMVLIKSEYIRTVRRLGGAMVLDLSQDDYSNRCGEGSFPLTTTISRTLGISISSSSRAPAVCGLLIILLISILSLLNSVIVIF